MSGKRQFILLIFGIKLDDIRARLCVEPHATQKSNTHASCAQSSPTARDSFDDNLDASPMLIDSANYALIPHSFVDLAHHPKSTNLLCWHCALPFVCTPRFIALDSARAIARTPGSEDGASDATVATEWVIDGNFCSWACAAAYIDDNYRDQKKWSLQQNLSVVRAQIDNCPIRAVKRAPNRTIMSAYVGSRGISQHDYAQRVAELSVFERAR